MGTVNYFGPDFHLTEEHIALLTNLALLQLIFASWNISATLSTGQSGIYHIHKICNSDHGVSIAPLTCVIIILESCVLFFCIAWWVFSNDYPSTCLVIVLGCAVLWQISFGVKAGSRVSWWNAIGLVS